MKAVILALVAAAIAKPQPHDQFDLVCSGTSEMTTIDGTKKDAFSTTYHLDLTTKKWCEGACLALNDIFEVQPASIKLVPPVAVDTVTQKEDSLSFIDRRTGAYASFRSVGRGAEIMMWETKASCEKQPFSGFPKIETKF